MPCQTGAKKSSKTENAIIVQTLAGHVSLINQVSCNNASPLDQFDLRFASTTKTCPTVLQSLIVQLK